MSNTPHLLLVEDEPAMLHILQATLDYGGLTSDVASTGARALDCLDPSKHAAVLLDMGLPDMDGSQLIRSIRGSSNIPILVISGRGAEQDKVAALDLGADDYIAKPFLPGELLARIRAILRRGGGQEGAAQAVAKRNSIQTIRLAPLERKLFDLLEERMDEVVSNEDIFQEVWGDKDRGPANLRLLVLNLRRKLNAHGEPVEISNVWGDGYRLSMRAKEDS